MKKLLSLIALSWLTTSVSAAKLSDIQMPDSISMGPKKLELNGMGLREATFLNIDVYVAGLYLENKSKSAKEILNSNQLKQIKMHFVRSVEKEKLQSAWKEGFEKNCEKDCEGLKPSLLQLSNLMVDMKEGNVMEYTFYPDRVELRIDNELKGTIVGPRFPKTLLACWLGKNPPNSGLKEGLLGNRS